MGQHKAPLLKREFSSSSSPAPFDEVVGFLLYNIFPALYWSKFCPLDTNTNMKNIAFNKDLFDEILINSLLIILKKIIIALAIRKKIQTHKNNKFIKESQVFNTYKLLNYKYWFWFFSLLPYIDTIRKCTYFFWGGDISNENNSKDSLVAINWSIIS